VANSTALPTGTALIIGAGGTFIFNHSVTAAPGAADREGMRGNAAPVPEPGAVALLAIAGLAAGFRIARRYLRFQI
jgi:hypothetical protein